MMGVTAWRQESGFKWRVGGSGYISGRRERDLSRNDSLASDTTKMQ